ncbi:hypothetical protein [Micromonospora sp. NBS 11-29]|nr:hypothetical protein [Micromonospora sp. NBS 11-29]
MQEVTQEEVGVEQIHRVPLPVAVSAFTGEPQERGPHIEQRPSMVRW